MKGFEVSVDELLAAKDERIKRLKQMASRHPDALICYKLNVPGPVKTNDMILNLFHAGLKAWLEGVNSHSLTLLEEKQLNEKTGPEYFAAIMGDPLEIKKMTAKIEETHPLGRLFDFDVMDQHLTAYGRTEIGFEPRKCLICDENAFVCGRSRAHELSELTEKISELATRYTSLK